MNVPIYDGDPIWNPNAVPFGFYNNDVDFQVDCVKVAKFVTTRLGYPLMDVELQSGSIFTAFEEAITTYGNELWAYLIRENTLDLIGLPYENLVLNEVIVSPNFETIVRLSEQYGEEAGVGGNVPWYKGSIPLSSSVQDYDLKVWAKDQGITGSIEIKRVFYQEPIPASARYLDPFDGFGFGGVAEQDHQLIEKEILEKSSMPEPTKISEDVFLKNNSPILGNPNAPITLIEFGDFQCHFCNVYFQNIEPMIIENFVETGKVNVIFKDYTIIGPDSFDAAYGAHCASEQNKYWEYHNILFKNWAGENNGWAGKQNLVKFADDINLDLELFSECMNSTRYSDMINQSGVDAQTLGITGTPAFFILDRENGQVLTIIGAQPYEVFEKVFNSMLEI